MTNATPLTNWAGNVRFTASELHRPTSIPELQRIVAHADRVRALGTGHSFNEIADTTGELVSLSGLPPRLDIDSRAWKVTVGAGLRYGDLGPVLHRAGFAIPNTGSLPHISIAGASSTGTHGSGNTLGNVATFVSAIEMITANGDLLTINRSDNPGSFDGMVLALGSLGIVTALTLDLERTFRIRQDVYEHLPHEQFLQHLDQIMGSGYSVSAFSTWQSPREHQIWVKSRTTFDDVTPAAATLHSAILASATVNPMGQGPTDHITEQRGVPGPWHERLPHFRLDFTPSSGQEIQSEYLLPRWHAADALRALDDIARDIAAVLQVSEIRTTAPDTLWLSPSHRRETACLHFTWIDDEAAIAPVVTAIEQRLAAFDARPHWGKRFNVRSQEIDRLYPRLGDFRALMLDLDPARKFVNRMVHDLILTR